MSTTELQVAFSYPIYLELFLKLNFLFFSFSTLMITVAYYFLNYRNPSVKLLNSVVNRRLKFTNIICYLISFILFLVSFYFFLNLTGELKLSRLLDANPAYTNQFLLTFFGYKFEISLFGYILLLLAYVIGFLSLLTLDTRLSRVNFNFFIYFNYFILFVFLFVVVNDILLFFFFYELLLLPSFFFVYFVSYSKKAIQASLYFVI